MKAQPILILILIAIQTAARVGQSEEPSSLLAELRALPSAYETAVRPVRNILKTIPDDARSFSDEQFAAIIAAGIFRDEHSVADLLRVAPVKYRPLRRGLGHGLGFGFALNPRFTVRRDFEFDDYPAAKALKSIGLNSASAICAHINTSGGKVDDKRLAVYAEILRGVLYRHSAAFLAEERTHAPKSAMPLYDKLQAMPLLQPSDFKYRISEP